MGALLALMVNRRWVLNSERCFERLVLRAHLAGEDVKSSCQLLGFVKCRFCLFSEDKT